MVDFKTDRVTAGPVAAARAEEYRPQLEAYSRALEEITGKQVVRRGAVVFRTGRADRFCERATKGPRKKSG